MRAEDPMSGLSRTMIAPDVGARRRTQGAGAEAVTSTMTTAEIPAVPAGPNYGVLLPDGTIWYPGSRKRLPAPLPLRVAVWALAFLVLIAGAGDFVVHTHPSWVDPLRRIVPNASILPTTPVGATHHSGTGVTSAPKFSAVVASPQPGGVPPRTTDYYVTGTQSYTVSVKAGTAYTWITASKLANGQLTGAPLFTGTLSPGQTENIAATGPIDLQVDATGASISVQHDYSVIGVVHQPTTVPWHFRFITPAFF